MLDYEVAHAGLTELHVVETMHERKAMMAERECFYRATWRFRNIRRNFGNCDLGSTQSAPKAYDFI